MMEARFKTRLIRKLYDLFPGCIIFHPDAGEIQGIPDILILYEDTWAALEGKKTATSSLRPNQDIYVDLLDQMSFARFIYPENEEEVLYDLQRAFKSRR